MLTDFLVIVVITVLIGLILLNIWMIWFVSLSYPVKKVNHDFHPELNQGPADLQSAAPTIIPPRICIQSNKHRPPSVYRARAREQNTTCNQGRTRTQIEKGIGRNTQDQKTQYDMMLCWWPWELFTLLRSWASRKGCRVNIKMTIDCRLTMCTVHDCVHVYTDSEQGWKQVFC